MIQQSHQSRIWVRDIHVVFERQKRSKIHFLGLRQAVGMWFFQCLQPPGILLKITHFLLQTA